MRWEIASADAKQEVYHLYKSDKKILTLVINPFSGTARVECANEKRVFQIRREGLLRNKITLKNEYGVKIGELGEENREKFIDVNGERFYYTTHNNPLAELVLYKESKDRPFVSCGLSAANGNPEINFTKNKGLGAAPHPGLLMALCWYMFLPVAKENVVEFAS